MACQVLRCPNTANNAVVLSEQLEGIDRHVGAFCQDHFERIQAGEPWLVDTDSALEGLDFNPTVVLMGADLEAKGLRFVTGTSSTRHVDYYTPSIGPFTRLTLTVKVFGSDKEDKVTVYLDKAGYGKLKNAIPRLDPESGRGI